jgi:hypothetical protein
LGIKSWACNSDEYKLGGLLQRDAVATWNLGTLSTFFKKKIKLKIKCFEVELLHTCKVNIKVTLHPTASRPVCLGVTTPSGAQDQIFCYCQTVESLLMWGRPLLREDEFVVYNCCWSSPVCTAPFPDTSSLPLLFLIVEPGSREERRFVTGSVCCVHKLP